MPPKPKLCGELYEPDNPKLAEVVCGRKVTSGKHTGTHIQYDENGHAVFSWWGGQKRN